MPCPGPFHCSYSVDIYDFCPLPGPDVGFSIFVCDVELFFPFWSVRQQVCSVLVWSVSRARIHESVITRYDGHNTYDRTHGNNKLFMSKKSFVLSHYDRHNSRTKHTQV